MANIHFILTSQKTETNDVSKPVKRNKLFKDTHYLSRQKKIPADFSKGVKEKKNGGAMLIDSC